MNQVAEAYNLKAALEWNRLAKDAYHTLEFDVTMHYLSRHLPPTGLVLDAGGGPGRYSLALCRQGYDVVLYDLSPGNIELARANFAAEPPEVQAHLRQTVVGDICNITCYPDGSFDSVLCLGGPLTHIPEAADRERAVAELVRVAKPGGVVAIAVVGYLAVLRDGMEHWNDDLVKPSFQKLIATGEDFGPTHTIWHFFRADEIRQLAETTGLRTLDIVGCQGLSAGTEEATNRLAEEPEKWAVWKQVIFDTANIPAVADMAEHILYIGQK